MLHYIIAQLLNSFTTPILGLIVYLKNRKSLANKMFALYDLAIAIWAFSFFKMVTAQNETEGLFWSKALHIGAILIPIFFLHFIFALLEIIQEKKKIIIAGYIASFIMLAFLPTNLFVSHTVATVGFKYFVGPAGIHYFVFLLFFFICLVYGLYELFIGLRRSRGLRRNQIRYLFLALLIGYSGGPTAFLPLFNIAIPSWGLYTVSISVFIITYAIVRYRLMDINIAITRAAILAIVYALVLGVPIGLVACGRPWLIGIFGQSWVWIPMFILIGLATLGPFIYSYLQEHAENRLLRDQRRYQKNLQSVSKEMTLIKDLDKLVELVVHVLTKTMRITYAGVYLYDKEKEKFVLTARRGTEINPRVKEIKKDSSLIKCLSQTKNSTLLEELKYHVNLTNAKEDEIDDAVNLMRDMNATLIIPSYIGNEIFTMLVLGDKLSGQIYTKDDLSALSLLANQAALAIENAQFINEKEELQARLRESEKLRATGEMLGSVRHEMGNIINKVSGGIQMMDDMYLKGDKEKYNKLRNKIVDNITSAKTIWKYVDDYKAKSESGKIVSFKLRDMIDKAISNSNGLLVKWNIKVTTTIDPRITLRGKETLPDIFKHLVINSCYGMESDEPEKARGDLIFRANLTPETNTVEIVQTDTGADLTRELKGRKLMGGELFAEQGKIGGINLFLARRIIHDHNGSFDIQSNDGKGTKFVVKLPLGFTNNNLSSPSAHS